MTQQQSSPLLNALENARTLIWAHRNEMHRPNLLPEEEDVSDRGNLRGFPNWPIRSSTPSTSPAITETYLAKMAAQIAQVQAWLHANPELLRILDQGIRNEVKQMEDRANRTAIIINAVFTLVGTVIGLVLPLLLTWASRLLGY